MDFNTLGGIVVPVFLLILFFSYMDDKFKKEKKGHSFGKILIDLLAMKEAHDIITGNNKRSIFGRKK